MGSLPAGGAMAAVPAQADRVAAAIAREPLLEIAAHNGPANTVIAGDAAALRRALDRMAAEGVIAQPLAVSHAFHSRLIEPILDCWESAAAAVTTKAPRLAIVSNLDGPAAFDARHWRRHAREPVRFAKGMEALARRGCSVFIEIGPHPVLLGLGAQCVEGGLWLPSLRAG